MKRLLIAAAAALWAGSAHAAIMQATWTGTVRFGTDDVGVWGTPGEDLTGRAATAVFKYDTTIGQAVADPGVVGIEGGTDFSQPTPILDAWIEISGVQLHFAGDNEGASLLGNAPGLVGMTNYAWTNAPLNSVAFLDAFAGFVPDLDITHPFQRTFGSGDTAYFEADLFEPVSPYSEDYLVVADVNTLTVERLDAGAVPEPAAWLLMILGFGASGALLRRRHALA